MVDPSITPLRWINLLLTNHCPKHIQHHSNVMNPNLTSIINTKINFLRHDFKLDKYIYVYIGDC